MHRSIVGGHSQQNGLYVVAEEEAGIDPVNAIKRDVDWLLLNDVVIRGRLADDAHSRYELATDDLLSNLAVWHHAELKLFVEPSA